MSYQYIYIYIPCAGAAEMLLYKNGKFTIEKLKSSLLSYRFVINRPSLSTSMCRSRYEVDLSVYLIFYILSSMGQMRSTKSPNLELFGEKTSSIQRNVKLKDRTSFFTFFLRSSCMKSGLIIALLLTPPSPLIFEVKLRFTLNKICLQRIDNQDPGFNLFVVSVILSW